jgi:hypothetical protein
MKRDNPFAGPNPHEVHLPAAPLVKVLGTASDKYGNTLFEEEIEGIVILSATGLHFLTNL